MKFLDTYNQIIEETQWLKDIKIKSGKMTRLLNIPNGKKIIDVYTSGEKLAKDLVKAVGGNKKKAAGMLAIPANANPENNVFDVALKSIHKV